MTSRAISSAFLSGEELVEIERIFPWHSIGFHSVVSSVSVSEVVSIGERGGASVVTVASMAAVGSDAVTNGDVIGVGVGGCTTVMTCSVADGSSVVASVVLWVHCFPSSLHHCVEAVVLVGGVFHGSDGAIGFMQAVGTLHHVSVPGLPLTLGVSGFVIADAVIEVVFGIGLKMYCDASVQLQEMHAEESF